MTLIIALISAVSFFVLPVLLGNFIITLFRRRPTSLVSSFTIGSLAYFVFTFLLYYLLSSSFISVYPLVIKIFTPLLLLFNLKYLKNIKITLKTNWLPLIGISILASIIYFIWRLNTAYPLPLNWDFFHHQTLVNQIISGRLSFLNSRISDTFVFNGYTPIFHLLLAWPQWLFSPDVLQFFWWLEFFYLFSALTVTYFVANHFFHSKATAFIAAIFSGFIFESFIIYTPLMLIPQTLVALIFLALIPQFINYQNHHKINLTISLIFLFLTHFVIGTLAVFFLLALLFISKIKYFRLNFAINSLILITLTFLALSPFISIPIDLSFINQGEANAFNLSLGKKLEYFQMFSGFILLISYFLGLIRSFFRSTSSLKFIAFLSLASLVPVFISIPYSLKFYVISHFLLSLIAAFGFSSIFKLIKSYSVRCLVIILLIFSLSLILLSSTKSIKNTLKNYGYDSQISPSELLAANFLNSHYDHITTLLISDPATQQILEPLSHLNTQGGAYTNIDTRNLLVKINTSNSPLEVYQNLHQIQDTVVKTKPITYLFALSGRYFRWQTFETWKKQNIAYNAWSPSPLAFSNLNYINWLKSSPSFKLVFFTPDIAIFELQP